MSHLGPEKSVLQAAKQQVRSEALLSRASISDRGRAEAAERIQLRLLELPALKRASVVLGYSAHGSELRIDSALSALASTARIAYPRVIGDTEIALHSCGPEMLEPGYKGIMEPPTCAQAVTADQVSVVLVPGVAFDTSRNRLGYGKGYYDRLLAQMPRALKVGISYDETLYDSVPVEGHDAPLDLVITPTRTIGRIDL